MTRDASLRADGRRTAVTEKFYDDGGTSPFETNTFSWTYDDAGRLIQETASGTSLDDYTLTWEFDLAGYRVSQLKDFVSTLLDDESTTYTLDANDRLTTETLVAGSTTTTVNYSYDHTQQTGKSTDVDGVPTSNQIFEYDLQGRMSILHPGFWN